jgi:hypothetical protein
MAQHDYVIANGTGAAVRSDLNNALAAIVSNNSGATAPSPTYAFQPWADTTAGVMKMRNSANSAWITLYQLDGEWTSIAFENGTAAAPSIYFKDSGTDTGFYSPGTDQVGISTGGTARLTIDANGNVNIDSNTLYVDAANNRVGLGTSAPSDYDAGANKLVIADTTNSGITIRGGTTGQGAIYFADGTTGNEAFRGRIEYSHSSDSLNFGTAGTGSRVTLDSSGRLGIGITAPTFPFHLQQSSGGTLANFTNGADADFQITCTSGVTTVGPTSGLLAFRSNSTERARIDSSGRLLVGTSSSSANAAAVFQGFAASASGQGIIQLQVGKNTAATGVNEILGSVRFANSDGNIGALISGEADLQWNSGDYPSRLVFSTTADGASSPTERARITNGGFFKASNGGSGNYVSTVGTYHESINSSSGDHIHWFRSTTSSNPYGIRVDYISADPNGTGSEFLYCVGYNAGTGTLRASIRSNGGLANFSANNVNLSDRNVKKDIVPAAGTWDCLKEWEIVNFRYKDQPEDAELNMGVIAQQVAESCPEVITVFQEAKEATEDQPAQEERLGVKDQQMMWMAIKALQEAQLRIETLEAEVAALKGA